MVEMKILMHSQQQTRCELEEMIRSLVAQVYMVLEQLGTSTKQYMTPLPSINKNIRSPTPAKVNDEFGKDSSPLEQPKMKYGKKRIKGTCEGTSRRRPLGPMLLIFLLQSFKYAIHIILLLNKFVRKYSYRCHSNSNSIGQANFECQESNSLEGLGQKYLSFVLYGYTVQPHHFS